jgi:hypothetical protein
VSTQSATTDAVKRDRREAGRAAGKTSQPLAGNVDVERTEGEEIEIEKVAS